MDAIEHLLRAHAAPEPFGSIAEWLDRLDGCPFADPLDRALWAGFTADRLGYAFVGGYQAALARLLQGGRPLPNRLSLAATESGGGHPRAIATKVEGGRLTGEKTFATLASVAAEILVVAREGEEAGRPKLVIVRVAPDAPNMTITAREPTPFAPEVPHARLHLDGVPVGPEDVLPGDGYARYLKPFRTLEDTHVLAAVLGHLVGEARRHRFADAVVEPAIALAETVRGIARMAPDAPQAHVALAGAFTLARRHIAEHDAAWSEAPPQAAARWRRDLALMMVADSARNARTAAAWKTLRA